MSLDRELNFLLSTEYDPATQSLFKFRQAYNRIAEHRDRLCWEINRKKQRRVDIRQAECECLGQMPSCKRAQLTLI